jgi:hypothetical protein
MNIELSRPIWDINHVADALFVTIDRAREYTYRADFPAAKDGFAKNLWLREDVLDWFAGLQHRPAKRSARGRAPVLALSDQGTAFPRHTCCRFVSLIPAPSRLNRQGPKEALNRRRIRVVAAARKYPDELREPATTLAVELRQDPRRSRVRSLGFPCGWACTPETLRG